MKHILIYSFFVVVLFIGCKSTRTTNTGGNPAQTDSAQTREAMPAPTVLLEAARTGDLGQLKTYLAGGGSINVTDEYHTTLLHFAADGGQEQVAAFLIEKGLGVNTVNDDGFTPLHNCALHGDSATAALLIAKGATVYVRDNNQMAPLHLCGMNNNVAVAKVLVARGADVNDMNANKWTPLRVAQYGKSADLEVWLKANGAKE